MSSSDLATLYGLYNDPGLSPNAKKKALDGLEAKLWEARRKGSHTSSSTSPSSESQSASASSASSSALGSSTKKIISPSYASQQTSSSSQQSVAELAETGAASHVLENLLGKASTNLGGDNRRHLEAQLSIMKQHCARLQRELRISAPSLAKRSGDEPRSRSRTPATPKVDVAGVPRQLRDSPSRRRGPSSDVIAQRQQAWQVVCNHLRAPEPELAGLGKKKKAPEASGNKREHENELASAAENPTRRRLSAASASRFSAVRSMQGHIATGSGHTRLRVGGVPEHFNAPFHLAKASGALEDAGVLLDWKVCAGGTGQMMQRLRDGEVDCVVALTEGVVKSIVEGDDTKIVGVYVASPLTWGVHVSSAATGLQTSDDLRGRTFGISRYTSGSHLMSFVHAKNRGWDPTARGEESDVQFEVVKNLEGARVALREGRAEAFLWEKFTTQHLVSSGEWRRIDECTTPWPCFVIAASGATLRDRRKRLALLATLKAVRATAERFKAGHADAPKAEVDAIANVSNNASTGHDPSGKCTTVDYLARNHKQTKAEAREWLAGVRWQCSAEIELSTLRLVTETLVELGVLDAKDVPEKLSSLTAKCITTVLGEDGAPIVERGGIAGLLPRESIFSRRC